MPASGSSSIAVASDDEGRLAVSHQQHRLKPAAAPDRSASPWQARLPSAAGCPDVYQFGFKTVEQRKGVSGTSGEASQNLVLKKAPDFSSRTLDDHVAGA